MRNVVLLVVRLSTVVVSSMLVLWVFGGHRMQSQTGADALSISSVEVGTRPLALESIKKGTRRTLVLILRGSDCANCDASIATYQKVADACARRGDAIKMIVLSLDTPAEMESYLAARSIRVDQVYSFPRMHTLNVSEIPMTLVLNAAGVIEQAWSGTAAIAQQDALLALCAGIV